MDHTRSTTTETTTVEQDRASSYLSVTTIARTSGIVYKIMFQHCIKVCYYIYAMLAHVEGYKNQRDAGTRSLG